MAKPSARRKSISMRSPTSSAAVESATRHTRPGAMPAKCAHSRRLWSITSGTAAEPARDVRNSAWPRSRVSSPVSSSNASSGARVASPARSAALPGPYGSMPRQGVVAGSRDELAGEVVLRVQEGQFRPGAAEVLVVAPGFRLGGRSFERRLPRSENAVRQFCFDSINGPAGVRRIWQFVANPGEYAGPELVQLVPRVSVFVACVQNGRKCRGPIVRPASSRVSWGIEILL